MRIADLSEKGGKGRVRAVQVFADLGQMVQGRLQVETGLIDDALRPCERGSCERGQGTVSVVQNLGEIFVSLYDFDPKRRNAWRRIAIVRGDRGRREHAIRDIKLAWL